jgi:hypothetical protein
MADPYRIPLVSPYEVAAETQAAITTIARAFNVRAGSAKVALNSSLNNNPYTAINRTVTADAPLYDSALGTPVFSDLTLQSVTYTDFSNPNRPLITTPTVKWTIVLFNVTLPTIVVKTTIQGRKGTVKEYIGEDDYSVTINGILPGPNGSYPVQDVANLKAIKSAPVPIPVTSSYLNNLGIHTIVFTSLVLDQEPGGYSKQNFTLEGISDEPINVQLV